MRARPDRLYVVGRADLPPGLRTAQIAHAAGAWVLKHGKPPEHLIALQVADEARLDDVSAFCLWEKLDYVEFEDPDLADEDHVDGLGAVAFVVTAECWEKHFDSCCRRYLRDMDLALSEL